jgi:N-acetylglutamate synthase-like GNAT family acetyltransferase
MLSGPIRHRRCRRTDFVAVLSVLAAAGLPVPPADRSMLRRFRRLVSDLGTDFYVATQGEQVVGFVHVTYVRQLATGMRARIEALVVAPAARGRGVGSSLVELARRRAGRRSCHDLCCAIEAGQTGVGALFIRNGWQAAGDEFRVDVAGRAQ